MSELTKKLAAIQSNLKAPKGQYNNFGKYKYRSAEDILEALKPHLAEQGCVLTLNDEVLLIGTRYYIKATVTISDGEDSITTSALAREDDTKKGMDGSQITGSSSSYARKYALNGLFCIDDTKDADTNEQHNQQGAYDSEYNSAMGEIAAATDMAALQNVWMAHPSLQSDSRFISAVTARKSTLTQAA